MEYGVLFYINNAQYKTKTFKNEQACLNYIIKEKKIIEKKYSSYANIYNRVWEDGYNCVLYDAMADIAMTFRYDKYINFQVKDFYDNDVFLYDHIIDKKYVNQAKISNDPIKVIKEHVYVILREYKTNNFYMTSDYNLDVDRQKVIIKNIKKLTPDFFKNYVKIHRNTFDEYVRKGKTLNYNKIILK